MSNKAYTTGQIAKHCHVTHRTVLDWIAQGKIKAYQTPGGHTRIPTENYLSFLTKYNIPYPKELVNESDEKTKILVVDDDVDMISSIVRILRQASDFLIETASDGFRAGMIFNSFKPDIVILDLRMPGVSGFEVCQSIRNNQDNIETKIIVITGLSDPELESRVRGLGANEFLPKPFDPDELIKAVHRFSRVKP